jgi:subtilisin-like proprotein convertase family protein
MLGTADNIDSTNSSTYYNRLGTGRINPYRAITQTLAAPLFGRTTNIPITDASAVAPTSFQIFTPDRLAPASVVASNFELRADGVDNTFNTPDDVIVPLTINANAAYSVGTNVLNFTRTAGGAFAAETYRLTAFSGASQLRNPFDTPLDGDTDGVAGGNWVRTFTWLAANVNSITGRTFIDFNGNGLRDSIDPNAINFANSYYLDADNDSIRDTVAKSTTATPALAIPAVGRVTASMTLSGFTLPVFDVDVRVSITHPRIADVDLFLVSPNGVRVALATDVGGTAANFVSTVFSDEAGTAITAGTAPFTSTYRPESLLSQLDNVTANGTWLLEVVDDNPTAITGTTTLDSWTITITTAEASVATDANGNFVFANLAPGTHVVRPLSAPSGHTATATGKSYSVTLPTSTSTVADRDFGYARNGHLYGVVANDANANGVLDAGEAGLAGQIVYHDANLNGIFDNFGTATLPSTDTPLTINDNTTFNSSLSVSGMQGLISDVNVTVNLTHTYVGDVRLRLTNPAGTQIVLSAQRGGSGDNYVNTVFDDEAAIAITAGVAPFTGSFRPEGLLSTFDGASANGTWKLEVADLATTDTGTLNNWSITFTNSETAVTTTAGGAFTLTRPAGAQTLGLVPSLGWAPTNPATGLSTFTFTTSIPLTNRNFLVTPDSIAPTLSPIVIEDGSSQRSRIRTIAVPFSERIRFTGAPAAAFTLTGPAGVVPVNVTLNGSATVATLTFTSPVDPGNSLQDGKYSLAINAGSITDVALNPFTPPAATNFHRLFGDVNGDVTVDGSELLVFGNAFASSNFAFDFDADNTIGGTDLLEFGNRFGLTL